MSYGGMFNINDLELNPGEYRKLLEFINKLKLTYGGILDDLVRKSKDPFIIAGFQTNIREGETTHLLRIIRNDGETFETNFKPAGMLVLLSGLIESIRLSMEKGVYNISQNAIDSYLTESEAMKQYILKLMEENKHE